eukprot:scaffold572_cov229-Amphora_coffeaeformis.AAC.8
MGGPGCTTTGLNCAQYFAGAVKYAPYQAFHRANKFSYTVSPVCLGIRIDPSTFVIEGQRGGAFDFCVATHSISYG